MIDRTKRFALRIIRLVASMPDDQIGQVIGRQVLRSGTSVGANYREATRAGSKKHFTSIMITALREADETLYWLELLAESGTISPERLSDILDECHQLVAILAASVKTAQSPANSAVPSDISNQTSNI